MIFTFNARKRPILYSPYTSKQEKDILLTCNDGTDVDIDRALRICEITEEDITYLTPDEKKALLYKLREVSVGEELPARFVCPHCNTPTEVSINISSVFTEPIKESKWIKDPGKAVFDITECFIEGYGDLDYDKYLMLKNNISEYVTTFNFEPMVKCVHCNNETKLNIDGGKFVITNMSEESLASLYKSYSSLVYNGHFTKQDIDSMYPFERMIFFGQIKQIIEERNKK